MDENFKKHFLFWLKHFLFMLLQKKEIFIHCYININIVYELQILLLILFTYISDIYLKILNTLIELDQVFGVGVMVVMLLQWSLALNLKYLNVVLLFHQSPIGFIIVSIFIYIIMLFCSVRSPGIKAMWQQIIRICKNLDTRLAYLINRK